MSRMHDAAGDRRIRRALRSGYPAAKLVTVQASACGARPASRRRQTGLLIDAVQRERGDDPG